jgi:hypothetical protein
MTGALAGNTPPSMATFTSLTDTAMIKTGNPPAHRSMAVVTALRAFDVIRAFTLCSSVVMTAGTMDRRAFEQAVFMATFALNSFVTTCQGKACHEVVETFILCVARGQPDGR